MFRQNQNLKFAVILKNLSKNNETYFGPCLPEANIKCTLISQTLISF